MTYNVFGGTLNLAQLNSTQLTAAEVDVKYVVSQLLQSYCVCFRRLLFSFY